MEQCNANQILKADTLRMPDQPQTVTKTRIDTKVCKILDLFPLYFEVFAFTEFKCL